MDFLRTRAIPALIALLSFAAAAADCSSLNGTYPPESPDGNKGVPGSLANLVSGPDRQKLFEYEKTPGQSFSSTEPKQRPKYKKLASRVTLTYAPGSTKLRFLDAQGKELAEFRLEATGKWACRNGDLTLESEQMAGTAEGIRTDRAVLALHRDGDSLVLSETVTTIDPPGGKARASSSRYKALP